ncbi:MAG: hypothetical protein ABSC76_17645 [Terracidiphilus sp.]|jgi:hypothetical protein
MKRSLALFFLILLCNRPVLAFGHLEVGQFYDGEAKPRSEVAWIWIKGDLHVSQIDHSYLQMSTDRDASFSMGIFSMAAVEVLPGKHVFTVRYVSDYAWSKGENQEVEIDAKTGENYFLDSDRKGNRWSIKTGTFSPKAKEMESLRRKVIERSVSVDGVVQSYESKHGHLVLTVPGSVQSREFRCFAEFKIGQKMRLFYFPSLPNDCSEALPIQ